MILHFHKPLKVWPVIHRECLCLISGEYYKNSLNLNSRYFPHLAGLMILDAWAKITKEQDI